MAKSQGGKEKNKKSKNTSTGEDPKLQKEKEANKQEEKLEVEAKISDTEQKIAAAEEKLSAAETKVTELNERLLRTAAEYENHRKRSQKEHESAFSNGIGYAVNEMLVIVDTLDAAANAETEDTEYKKGVLLTLSKCKEVFDKLGVEEIEALNEDFDPELHNAVMQQPAEGAESGTVTNVIQKGYKMGDKIVRHAMVAVAP